MFLNNLIILILFNEFSNVLMFLLYVCLLCFVAEQNKASSSCHSDGCL